MDPKAIETLAVNAVRDSVVVSDFLDQFIADNDKEPTWDGFVYIYSDKSKKKEKLKGRLPVQIKGTEMMISAKKKYPFQYQLSISTIIFVTAVRCSLLFTLEITERLGRFIMLRYLQ